jgi:hypothetical protein
MKADKYTGAAEIALAEGMAARGNPLGHDLSSAVPLTRQQSSWSGAPAAVPQNPF